MAILNWIGEQLGKTILSGLFKKGVDSVPPLSRYFTRPLFQAFAGNRLIRLCIFVLLIVSAGSLAYSVHMRGLSIRLSATLFVLELVGIAVIYCGFTFYLLYRMHLTFNQWILEASDTLVSDKYASKGQGEILSTDQRCDLARKLLDKLANIAVASCYRGSPTKRDLERQWRASLLLYQEATNDMVSYSLSSNYGSHHRPLLLKSGPAHSHFVNKHDDFECVPDLSTVPRQKDVIDTMLPEAKSMLIMDLEIPTGLRIGTVQIVSPIVNEFSNGADNLKQMMRPLGAVRNILAHLMAFHYTPALSGATQTDNRLSKEA